MFLRVKGVSPTDELFGDAINLKKECLTLNFLNFIFSFNKPEISILIVNNNGSEMSKHFCIVFIEPRK